MTNFEDYIFDPDGVEESLPEIQDWHIEPIKGLERDDLLELAVEMEQETIKKHQPNLQLLAEYLGGHYRINNGGRQTLANSIYYGFAIGKMVASKVYGVRAGSEKPTDESPAIHRRLARYYKDIEPDTLASVYEAQSLPLDMMIDAIDVNTLEQTARLRELIDFYLSMERVSPQAEAAAKLGAVVCYTAISFEKERTRSAALDKIWEDRRLADTPEGLGFDEMIAMTPQNSRGEIEGLRRARWYWPRLKRSNPAQIS